MRHIILILGCHRSGTSLVSKAMECLGAQHHEQALWKGKDNPTGFFEDRDVLDANNYLLKHCLQMGWDSAGPIDWKSINPVDAQQGQEYCTRLIAERSAQFPIWALKEPRMCRVLPFWIPALEASGAQVSVVRVVRHPLAVADSLMRRNSMSLDDALALWMAYSQDARQGVPEAWESVVVGYQDFIARPKETLFKISARLGLPLDVERSVDFIRGFVRRNPTAADASEPAHSLPWQVRFEWEKSVQEVEA